MLAGDFRASFIIGIGKAARKCALRVRSRQCYIFVEVK